MIAQPPSMVTLSYITSGDFTVYSGKHVYKNLNVPFHIVLIHELHQNYLPNNKTFSQTEFDKHFEHWKRQSSDERVLMVKQSQRYILEKFNTHYLMKMGIKGDVLREWKNNISNIHECIRAKFGSVTSYVLFFWWFFFFLFFWSILTEWSGICF